MKLEHARRIACADLKMAVGPECQSFWNVEAPTPSNNKIVNESDIVIALNNRHIVDGDLDA
jgi:hypothetical protein